MRLASIFLVLTASAFAQSVYRTPENEYAHHPESIPEYVRSEQFGSAEAVVDVDVTITPQGRVELVRIRRGPHQVLPKIQALLKGARYPPIFRNGVPVAAVIHDLISVVGPEQWLEPRQSFPQAVKNWSTFRAKLTRRHCDTCTSKDYSVEVRGDGKVIFDGAPWMFVPGRHYGYLDEREREQLLAAFRRSDFFSMRPSYITPITDSSGSLIELELNDRRKAVNEYVGILAGAPDKLPELRKSFEQIVGTSKWETGTVQTLRALQAEHWDFRAQTDENELLLKHSFDRGQPELIDYFLDHNSLSANTLTCGADSMARAGDLLRMRQIIAKMEPTGGPCRSDESTLLMAAVLSNREDIVREVLKSHPDTNARNHDGRTALMVYLSQLRNSGSFNSHILDSLIVAGADLNARDKLGYTPLLCSCQVPMQVINRLVKEGGDLNARTSFGDTALSLCSSEDTMRALVQAGADVDMAIDAAQKAGDKEKVARLRKLALAKSKTRLPNCAFPTRLH